MIENNAKFSFQDLFVLFGQNSIHNLNSDIEIEGISIDTRTIKKGNAFFAFKGDQVDGHSKVKEAFDKGASIAFVNKNWFDTNKESLKDLPIITVKNSYWGLGELANFHRNRFSIPVVAVAGSNGKTTTKELISSVLSEKYKVLKTYKNYNNQLGVPLMLLQINEDIGATVIEIATNSFGEIAELSRIVNPNHAIITNINKEHLEVLIDLDGVELEETNLFAFAKKQDIFSYINLDDDRLKKYTRVLEKKVTYGFNSEAMVIGEVVYDENLMPEIKATFKDESLSAKINVPGYPGAINALAAAAIGINLDIEYDKIKLGLEKYIPDDSSGYGRLSVIDLENVKILNDTYNANPGSVEEMLKLLSSFSIDKNLHIVLGDMLELGESTHNEHKLIFEKARELTHNIYTFGNSFKAIDEDTNFIDKLELSKRLIENLQSNDIILVKGSRGMKMEEVVQELLNKLK